MNMNNSRTAKLKTPQQLERVNQIIGSFREKLREANVKAAQAKADRKPFVTMRLADKRGAFASDVAPEFQPALQKMILEA